MNTNSWEKNEQRVQQFLGIYERVLRDDAASKRKPSVPATGIREAVHRMHIALLLGKYRADRVAVLKTCLHLGVRPTKSAIEAFLAVNDGDYVSAEKR